MLASCASTRPYARLSEAGVAYADASSRLMSLVGKARVDATSERLLQLDAVSDLNASDYQDLSKTDRERLQILSRMQAHAQLLGQYFSRLGQLASTKTPEQVSTSLVSIAGSLNTLGTELRGSPLLSKTDIGGMVAKSLIQAKAGRLLRRELEDRSEAIREEMVTQELLLQALSDDVRRDLERISTAREQRTVVRPLTSPNTLPDPDAWVAARQTILTGSGLPAELAAASAAAKELRLSFEAIINGDADSATFGALLTRIKALEALP